MQTGVARLRRPAAPTEQHVRQRRHTGVGGALLGVLERHDLLHWEINGVRKDGGNLDRSLREPRVVSPPMKILPFSLRLGGVFFEKVFSQAGRFVAPAGPGSKIHQHLHAGDDIDQFSFAECDSALLEYRVFSLTGMRSGR